MNWLGAVFTFVFPPLSLCVWTFVTSPATHQDQAHRCSYIYIYVYFTCGLIRRNKVSQEFDIEIAHKHSHVAVFKRTVSLDIMDCML